jgi:chromosome segregation ATPase
MYFILYVILLGAVLSSLTGKMQIKRLSNIPAKVVEVEAVLSIIQRDNIGSLEAVITSPFDEAVKDLEAFSQASQDKLKHVIDMRYIQCNQIQAYQNGVRFVTTTEESFEEDSFEVILNPNQSVQTKDFVQNMKELCQSTQNQIKEIKEEIEFYLQKVYDISEKLVVENMDSYIDRWPYIQQKQQLKDLSIKLDNKDLIEITEKILKQLCDISSSKDIVSIPPAFGATTSIKDLTQLITKDSSSQDIAKAYSRVLTDLNINRSTLAGLKANLQTAKQNIKNISMSNNTMDEQKKYLNYNLNILTDRLKRAESDLIQLNNPLPSSPATFTDLDNKIKTMKSLLPNKYDLEVEKLNKFFKSPYELDRKFKPFSFDSLTEILDGMLPQTLQ